MPVRRACAPLADPRPGDHTVLVPPLSKADSKGEVWGALPIYLHYRPDDPDGAFQHLAHLELTIPVTASARPMTPLISPDGVTAFTGSQLDSVLKSLLLRPSGVGAAAAGRYSWHSARIYLACSLLAAGATSAQIQALCRWQTEDSLRIYARLNPQHYRALLDAAGRADVSSVTTASLPPLSDELVMRQLLGMSLVDVTAAAAREQGD